MSLKKKIVSAALAASMLFSTAAVFSGCSDVSYVAVIDGETIPAGVYILYSGTAYGTAVEKIMEENPDLDTSAEGFDYANYTVEGVSFNEYIESQTMDYCKRYAAVNNIFDELGLSFTAEEEKILTDNVNSEWEYDITNYVSLLPYLKGCTTMGDYYQSLGIGQSSFRSVYATAFKASSIFDYYYGEGGVNEVPASEISQWIGENYSLTRYISVSLKDADGKLIEDEAQLKKLEELAEGYKTRLENGESFAAVRADYDAYVEAQKSGGETAETTTSADAEEAEADDAEETTAAEAEADDAEETTAAEAEADDAEETTAEEPEAAEETTAAEAEADDAEETTAAEAEADDAEETTAAEETAGESEEDKIEDSDYNVVISKDSASPSEEFVENAFSMDFNKPVIFKADTYYYVIVRLDITADAGYIEKYSDTALSELKAEYADYTFEENTGIPNYAEQAENALNAMNTMGTISYYSMFGY